MTKTLNDLDNKRILINEFFNGLEFEVIHAFSENVKNKKDGKVKDYTNEDKLEIGINIYKKIEKLYGKFTDISSGNDFGKYSLERLFEVNSGIKLADFATGIAKKFGLVGLTETYSLISSGLNESLQPAVFYGLEAADIENIRKQMADESKDRYHLELDETKINDVDALIKVYSGLRNGLSPELFDKVINKYKK